MRPELATIDGMPPPSDLPRGECIVTSLPGGRIRIDQADPRILISAELLEAVIVSPAPGVMLGTSDCITDGTPSPWPIPVDADCVGAILRIDAVNRTVMYRIVSYVPSVHGYIGEWAA